jgi:hypothetical protein
MDSVDRLLTEGERLSAGTRAAIVADGEAAIVALIAVLRDPDVVAVDSVGEGWAPIHAATLVGELRATAAVPVLLEVLEDSAYDNVIYSNCIYALKAIGAAVLEPSLAAITEDASDDFSAALGEVLCALGVHDERILVVLLAGLKREPELFAGHLARYGDPRAVPALVAAFDSLVPDANAEGMYANQASVEVVYAIDTLGGTLTATQRAHHDRLMAPRERGIGRVRQTLETSTGLPGESDTVRRSETKLGRNEPCWCGSGKKYKKCHL